MSADEVTDISCSEQLAVVIRTVNTGGVVRERLLEYICMESTTGESVSHAILQCLERHSLDIADCRAQTYDGAGNMSGRLNGCQARIKKLNPKADYYHCASHRLNLALNSTTKCSEFRVMLQNVKQLGIFYRYSPKRRNNLSLVLQKVTPAIRISTVSVSAFFSSNSRTLMVTEPSYLLVYFDDLLVHSITLGIGLAYTDTQLNIHVHTCEMSSLHQLQLSQWKPESI